jgi:hypothetical protein
MIVGLVNKIDELTRELDRNSQAWKRTNKQAVMMADSAAAGLIDTNSIIKQYNVLMEAGVRITDQQFRTLAARSTELAKATGKDATDAFIRLTNAIRSGSTEAFREYGVNLKQSIKLTDTHKNAIKGLTEGYENLTSKTETANERLDAFKNNVGTATVMIWSEAGSSGTLAFAFDELNKALETFNEEMAKSPKAMTKFVESGYALQGFLAELEIQILDWITAIPIAIEKQVNKPGLITNLTRILFGTGGRPAGVQGQGWLEQRIDDLKERMKQTSREALIVLENMKRTTEEDPFGGRGPRRVREVGGAGGGADLFDPGQGFLEEDLAAQKILEDHLEQQNKEKLEREKAAYEQEREMELQRIQESTEWQTEYFMFLEEEENKRLDRQRLGFFADKQTLAATEMMWKKSMQSRAQMMGGFFGIIGQLQQSENEKAWRIGKAANIAKTAIDTYTGAIAAYKSMAGIPYVGPFLGAAAAAAVTVMGLQAIRNIKATQFTDQGQPGFSPPTAPSTSISGGGSSAGMTGIPTGATQNTTRVERQEMTVNIVMRDEGAGLFDVVLEQNDRASRDGRSSLITSESKAA